MLPHPRRKVELCFLLSTPRLVKKVSCCAGKDSFVAHCSISVISLFEIVEFSQSQFHVTTTYSNPALGQPKNEL